MITGQKRRMLALLGFIKQPKVEREYHNAPSTTIELQKNKFTCGRHAHVRAGLCRPRTVPL